MQVQIIFTASGSSTATGNFAPGDTLRCSAEQASHYVNDAQCARYAELPAADQGATASTAPAKTTKRSRSAKDQA